MENQKVFRESLIKDFKCSEFLAIKKLSKYSKIHKFFYSTSVIVMMSSMIPDLYRENVTVAVIGVTGILFFDSKIRKNKDSLNEQYNSFDKYYKKYLNSTELAEFRIKSLNNLKSNNLIKRDYLILIQEELQLIHSLIKQECENDLNIGLLTYKNDIVHIFDILNVGLESGLLNKEDIRAIKKKWNSSIQYLYNQYSNTDMEMDLKYLQSLSHKKEV